MKLLTFMKGLLCLLFAGNLFAEQVMQYYDDQKYWTPQFVSVDYKYDGDVPYAVDIEFSFDNDLKLFKQWKVGYSGDDYCATLPYPFVLEVTFIVLGQGQGAINVGEVKGHDWSFFSTTNQIPYTYKDTNFSDQGSSKKMGIGIVRPELLVPYAKYRLQMKFSDVNPSIDWKNVETQVRFRLNIDVTAAGRMGFNPDDDIGRIADPWGAVFEAPGIVDGDASALSYPYTQEDKVVNSAFAILDPSALYIPINVKFDGYHSN